MKFKLNIPNKITIIRISLIPLFAAILLAEIPHKSILSAFVFIMLSISDFFDGYLARKKKQVTELGKLIDPIADKLLISTALVFLVAGKDIPLWMAAIIIARELIVTATRIYLLPDNLVIPASNFGRAKTVVQSIAIVAVLLQLPFSWHLMLIAVLLTLVSGIEYFARLRKLTRDKIVNVPNFITLARFLLIMPFAYYFLNSKINISLIIFAVIALSDKLDGISARLMKQATNFGSAFDSTTDWLFIFTTLMLFIYSKYIPLHFGISLFIFLVFIAIMKIYYLKKYREIMTSAISRLAVGAGYLTISSFLINFAYKGIFLTVSLVMAMLTLIIFFYKSRKKSAK
ncbi:CDP-diacylglycerol--glycerol-3-phosphate 3-phosphatidyltransferase [Candidatus Woesearchaeota archaeon]|nr:CDP-diacylglycerol--glycerol-3-phosphate 3-phosphatidyltransferase [Candidatus Woesearchaeota archaeon]